MNARSIIEMESPKVFLRSLGPRPIVPIRLIWSEVERVAQVIASGPVALQAGDQKFLKCGLFVRYKDDEFADDIPAVQGAPGAAEAFYDRHGRVRREWLAKPYSAKGTHIQYESQVQSVGGDITIDRETGQVLRCQLREGYDFAGYTKIDKFDLQEWRKYYLWEGELPRGFHVLDLGFWTKDGMFEAPDAEYRKLFKISARSEQGSKAQPLQDQSVRCL